MRWGAITTTWIDGDAFRLPELAWRDQVADARARLRASLWPCAQAAAASGSAWLLAHNALGHAQPFFAPIAAAIGAKNGWAWPSALCASNQALPDAAAACAQGHSDARSR